MKYNEYLTRNDQLEKIRTNSINSLDKIILTLATGELALSIAFLDKIGKPFDVITYVLIGVTWGGLALVLVFNMLSFHYAKINMDKKIAQLWKDYVNLSGKKKKEVFFRERMLTERCNKWAMRIFFLSMLTFFGYITAIQIDNYCKLDRSSNDTESPIIKMAGKTYIEIIKPREEVIMNTGISTPGETENERVVEEPIKNKMVDSDLGKGKGLTEIPEVIPEIDPPPPENNTSDSNTGQ